MGLDQIIVIIAVVAGIIGSIMEKAGKNKKTAPRPRVDPDEAARRRREQLAELTGQAQPENLRVGEYEERERARVAYEARAAELQAQRTGMADEETRMAAQRRVQRSGDDGRRSQLDRLSGKAQKKRRKMMRQTPTIEVQPQLEPASAHLEHLGESVSSRKLGSLDLGRGATEIDTYHVPGDQTMEHVHRHVADAPTAEPAGAPAAKSRLFSVMKTRSWRDAVLMKEILDPPLSERQSGR